jgi:hypothetical protein
MADPEPPPRDPLRTIRGEFLEIPGLRLTRSQIQQLWGLSDRVCAAVLSALLQERFLRLTTDSRYVRAGSYGW